MSRCRLGIASWLAVLLLVFVAGCGEETVTVPSVVSTIPTNGATGVAVNTPISATFSMAMNPASVDATSFTVTGPGGTAVAGAVSYSGLTATFAPAAALAFATTYTGTITTAATDLGGTPLPANYVWTFTTIAPTPAPTVISTVPVNAATGVPLNQMLSATFSEAMSCATLASPAATFVLTGPGASPVIGTVDCAGAVATFMPAADLVFNTVYTATITTAAEDLDGTPLGANYVWTFRTLPAPTPPTVISTVPVNLATGVPINQALSATFSVAMNQATIDTTTFTLVVTGGASVTGVVTYVATGSSVATFTPDANLAPSTQYTATITTGAQDLGNVGLAANYVWTFMTGTAVVTPPVLGPTISLFGAFGGNSGITNEGLYTVINNGDIGTTAASTLITGFHDDSVISSTGVAECTYTESTAPPATGLVGAASATSPGTGVIAIFTAPGTSQPTSGCPDEASGPATLAGTTAYVASQAAAEALAAYNTLQCSCNPAAGTTPTGVIGASLPSELGGLTLAPGTYTNATTVGITSGDLTLDAGGDTSATWIFQIGTTLTVGEALSPRSVTLINGANPANVYWLVGSAATINYGGGGTMAGTIISTAATTLSSPAQNTTTSATTILDGRALALFASTTMVNTVINVP
jgi:hypothetical protein